MAKAHLTINVKVHDCILREFYKDQAVLTVRDNGNKPVVPFPILRVGKKSWAFPIGDIDIPIRYCPYCGEDLDNG